MRAKKLFSILLAMMLMLFALFPVQAVLAETTNQPSQTTSTAQPPASSAVPTQRSDTPAPTSGAEPGAETPVDVSGQLGFFVQQYGLMVLLVLAVIVLVVLLVLLARSGRRKRTAETAQSGQTIAVMDMTGEPPILDVTEVGNVHNIGKRNYQQDAFGVSPLQDEKLRHSRGVLAVLADGMGGHKGGEVASTSARDDLLRELEGKTPSVATLSGAIEEVNRQIYHQQEHDDALTGMGTTLSVLWMSDNFVYIGHVGDSRVYLLRDGEFKQMTLDHSLVEQLVREGVLTEEEAQNHPMRNIITRAIGTDESVEVDVVVEERRKGDLWLACSDGLHGLVDDRQMRDALRQYAPEKAADVLLKAALDAGGRDNVTLVIVHDGEEPA